MTSNAAIRIERVLEHGVHDTTRVLRELMSLLGMDNIGVLQDRLTPRVIIKVCVISHLAEVSHGPALTAICINNKSTSVHKQSAFLNEGSRDVLDINIMMRISAEVQWIQKLCPFLS